MNYLVNDLIKKNEVGEEQKFILKNVVSEVFAEFFAAKVLTDLDFDKYTNLTNVMLNQLFKNTADTEATKKTKLDHIALAKSIYRYIKAGSDPVMTGLQIQNLVNISAPLAEAVVPFLKYISIMDDAVIDEIRKFYQSDNKREGFWDLWIFINRIRSDCYAEI